MSEENNNIENNQEKNLNKPEGNKNWWRKLLDLNKTYVLNIVHMSSILVLISIFLYFFYLDGVFAMENYNSISYLKYSFGSLPNFIEKRSSPSAILLKDGNVLFTGGRNLSYIPLRTTEIYNTKLNKFFKTADMNIPRYNHSSILLRDGNVLITGGNSSKVENKGLPSVYINSAEIYDTKHNKFIQISDMNYKMSLHNMFLLDDGNVLVVHNPNEIELFDSKNYTFKKINGISYEGNKARYNVLILNKDKILMYPQFFEYKKTPFVIINLNDLSLNVLDINPFRNMDYSYLSAISRERAKKNRIAYDIAKISDEEILVSGGAGFSGGFRRTRIINIKTKEEKDSPNLPNTSRYFHKSITLKDGNIIILGGLTGMDYSLRTLNTTDLYITKENKFIKFKKMKKKRCSINYIKLNDNNYLIYSSAFEAPEILSTKK